jgi:hypothetical protein
VHWSLSSFRINDAILLIAYCELLRILAFLVKLRHLKCLGFLSIYLSIFRKGSLNSLFSSANLRFTLQLNSFLTIHMSTLLLNNWILKMRNFLFIKVSSLFPWFNYTLLYFVRLWNPNHLFFVLSHWKHRVSLFYLGTDLLFVKQRIFTCHGGVWPCWRNPLIFASVTVAHWLILRKLYILWHDKLSVLIMAYHLFSISIEIRYLLF